METGETHLLLFTAQMDTLYFVNKKNYHDFFSERGGGYPKWGKCYANNNIEHKKYS